MEILNEINALPLLLALLCLFALAYRFYGVFLSRRALRLHELSAAEPAPGQGGGSPLLFGRHFGAICAAGPFLGPVLAAQFGYLPGLLWILVGCVLGGAAHDLVIFYAAMRQRRLDSKNQKPRGHSLFLLAGRELGGFGGVLAALGTALFLALALAAFSLALAQALRNSPWVLFLLLAALAAAWLGGVLGRRVKFLGPLVALLVLAAAFYYGRDLMQPDRLGWMFDWNLQALLWFFPAYALLASLLPTQALLEGRDRLSLWLKGLFILALLAGLLILQPELRLPALTGFSDWFLPGAVAPLLPEAVAPLSPEAVGSLLPGAVAPLLEGPLLPFIFITITCGAVSGFHAVTISLYSARLAAFGHSGAPAFKLGPGGLLGLGYGAMLLEGLVAALALLTVCLLPPGDFFAVAANPEAYAALVNAGTASGLGLDLAPSQLAGASDALGLDLTGRGPLAALALALGLALQELGAVWFDQAGLLPFFYNGALLALALFILTALDSGARLGLVFVQEAGGRLAPPFNNKNWLPGKLGGALLFCLAWGWLLHALPLRALWPLFGLGGLFLAVCGLWSGGLLLYRLKRGRGCLCFLLPGTVLSALALWAAGLWIFYYCLPRQDYLTAGLAGAWGLGIISLCACLLRRWGRLASLGRPGEKPPGASAPWGADF